MPLSYTIRHLHRIGIRLSTSTTMTQKIFMQIYVNGKFEKNLMPFLCLFAQLFLLFFFNLWIKQFFRYFKSFFIISNSTFDTNDQVLWINTVNNLHQRHLIFSLTLRNIMFHLNLFVFLCYALCLYSEGLDANKNEWSLKYRPNFSHIYTHRLVLRDLNLKKSQKSISTTKTDFFFVSKLWLWGYLVGT